MTFIPQERRVQGAWLTEQFPDACGYGGSAYRLTPENRLLNLAPGIREAAEAYFADLHRITWHRHVNHGLSSQICCLNFLMPLAKRPDVLAKVIGSALGISPPRMEPVETGPGGEDWYVGFEWIGERDYLNEAPTTGRRTRGANATSADAIVKFKHEDRLETLLIEWKYTETYGSPLGASGNPTRIERYKELVFAPDGPIRDDLGLKLDDFFWEPFYQLLRQQMLAVQMERANEAGTQRVRVLHISPYGNKNLHKVTSSAPAMHALGTDAFEVFKAALVDPAAFIGKTTEQVFGPVLAGMPNDPWSEYLLGRYAFLNAAEIP